MTKTAIKHLQSDPTMAQQQARYQALTATIQKPTIHTCRARSTDINMKTGKLFEFSIDELSEALRNAFADDAVNDFDENDEVQCGGCLHKTNHLFVVAETKLHALRAINHKKMGLPT